MGYHQKPNIVVIVLDAVRAKNLPFYGYRHDTTPFLSSIKNELAIYENAISSSYWTMPSVASLFTGMYTSAHGLLVDGCTLDEGLLSLPVILKQNDYRCAGFVRNVYVSEYTGLNRGFDDFYTKYSVDELKEIAAGFSNRWGNNSKAQAVGKSAKSNTDKLKKKPSKALLRMADMLIDAGSSRFVSDFSTWIDKHKDGPFFAFFQFLETHSPCRTPLGHTLKHFSFKETYKRLSINHDHLKFLMGDCKMEADDFSTLQSIYDNSIRYTDGLIKNIVHLLKKNRVYDNTWLIILSDHGDNLGEHGLMFHYFCLYDELIKIPLLMKYPASVKITGKIPQVVQNVDILPTILSALNIKDKRIGRQIQGNDILGKGISNREPELAISELIKVFGPERMEYKNRLKQYDRRLLSLRTRDRKLIYSSRGDHECYDLANDPGELTNLYGKDNSFSDLMQKAVVYYENMNSFYLENKEKIDGNVDTDQIDRSTVEKLKSLGYL